MAPSTLCQYLFSVQTFICLLHLPSLIMSRNPLFFFKFSLGNMNIQRMSELCLLSYEICAEYDQRKHFKTVFASLILSTYVQYIVYSLLSSSLSIFLSRTTHFHSKRKGLIKGPA